MKTRFLFFTFFILHVYGYAEAAEIKFLGNANDKEMIQSFDLSAVKKELPALYASLIENSAATFEDKNGDFSNLKMLKKTLYIGASIGGQIGIGDVLKVEATPGFFLIFEK